MNISLEQVAQKARVSTITARRAMRGDDCVRPTTRERIKQMARELGYQPNVAARQLKKNLRQNVGLLVACRCPSSEVGLYLSEYSRFIASLSGALGFHEHNLMIGAADETVSRDNVDSVLPRIVDGGYVNKLVVLSDMWPHFADQLRRLRIPTIVMDGPDCGLSSVQVDESHSAENLTDRFIELGHRRIAFCNHSLDLYKEDSRLGYRDALWPRGYFKSITRHQLTPVPGWDEFDQNVDATIDRLLKLKDPPTGIIAYDDQAANLIVSKLIQRGISVPRQISVAGLHCRGFGPYVDPMITHMSAPLEPMGQRVATMLAQDDRQLLNTPSRILVEATFFKGQTLTNAPNTA